MTDTNDRSQFKKIDIGDGPTRRSLITNDRLEILVIELQNLQENNENQTVKLNGAIAKLNNTIREANEKNDRIQVWFFSLAAIGTMCALLSLVQVIDIIIRGIGK